MVYTHRSALIPVFCLCIASKYTLLTLLNGDKKDRSAMLTSPAMWYIYLNYFNVYIPM